tara:strand:+ start:315 stop:827 length:513 start_codon:yes stop_codon:yes gene_type:complete
MIKTLFNIADDMIALDDLLTEVDGDVSDPEVADYVDQLFQENSQNLKQKVENYCWLIREKEARSKALQAEADRLAREAKIETNKAKGLKDRLMFNLERQEIKKVQTDQFRVSIASNGGKLPLHVEEHLVPDQFKVTVLKTDNQKIRQALEAGENLEFAMLGQRGKRLNLK